MHIKYRPEIDGLRAIAVLSVVIYHAELMFKDIKLVQGGFIGVDIFFVISGYLISKIVLREIEQNRFSFLNFYERRARRILPALLLVMLVSIPFALDRLLPLAMEDYAASVISSLLMISNYWFAASDSYWGEPSALKPFLHTWSLSVEEQFYVVFPIFLLVAWRYAKHLILVIICIGFVASLGLAEWTRIHNPESAFFLAPSRGWELLAGAILAKLELDGKRPSNSKINRIWPALGLLLIVVSMFVFSEATPHPSLITFIPVLGVMLIIRFAKNDDWASKILSTRLMVGVGLISYSLYLWHFPIFAFDAIKHGEITVEDKIENIFLAILLAILSYYLVERPARNKKIINNWVFFTLIPLCIGGLLMFNYQAYSSKGLPDRFVNFQKLIEYERYDYTEPFLSHTCFLHPEDLPRDKHFPNCKYNAGEADKPTLMLWGDSNAAHLIPGIIHSYAEEYQLLIRTTSGCGAFIGLEVPARPGCKEINDALLDLAVQRKPDKLIIAGLWKLAYPELLEKTLKALKAKGVENIVVIGPVPRWRGSLPRALIAHGQKYGPSQSLPRFLTNPEQYLVQTIETKMAAMTKRNQIEYVSVLDYVCVPRKGCQTSLDSGELIQWDYGHLTAAGAIHIVEQLSKNEKMMD